MRAFHHITYKMADYAAIVIGAGIEGSATAYHLAKKGHKTLLLEQFPLPHSRGSSHGQSRIIRKSYKEQFFANMMEDAYVQWRQLERDTNTKLLEDTGYLVLQEAPHGEVADTEAALRKIGAKCERMSGTQVRRRFFGFNCSDGCQAIYEPSGGIIMAAKSLQAYQEMFQRFGGVIQDGEQVVELEPGKSVKVKTSKRSYVTSHVVITAGPWTNRLTRPLGLNLPLQPIRINVCYWKTKPGVYSVSDTFPPFVIVDAVKAPDGSSVKVFGLPCLEYPNQIKLCVHWGPAIDPEHRDAPSDTWDIAALKDIVRKYFPEAEPTPSVLESCIYTVTPDKSFILDKHPVWNNITIGAGFSGTGFKLAPVVGQILSELVTGKQPSHDLQPFRMARFSGVASTSTKL